MYLGNTLEEKQASMDELCRRAKKIGKIGQFAVGIPAALLYIYVFCFQYESIPIKLFGLLCAVVSPKLLYYCAFFWYWGFITVKSWFIKYNVSVGEVASAAGTSVAVSYLWGGKKAAKTSLIIIFFIAGIVLSIGFYVGIFNYFSLKKQLKTQIA